MDEYKARLQSVVDYIRQLRSSSGITSNTLSFGLLSLMLSRKRITKEDLDVIFEVERKGSEETLKSLYIQNLGEKGFELENEQDLANANKLIEESIDIMKRNVVSAANEMFELTPPKKKRKKADILTTDRVVKHDSV